MKKITSRLGIASVAAFASVNLAACGGDSSRRPLVVHSHRDRQRQPSRCSSARPGEAETASVKKAVAAWSAKSGSVKADVIAANNLVQEASQGFAAKPATPIYRT